MRSWPRHGPTRTRVSPHATTCRRPIARQDTGWLPPRRCRVPCVGVTVLLATHPQYALHDTGRGHPERPARLEAVRRGIVAADLAEALVAFEPAPAPRQ